MSRSASLSTRFALSITTLLFFAAVPFQVDFKSLTVDAGSAQAAGNGAGNGAGHGGGNGGGHGDAAAAGAAEGAGANANGVEEAGFGSAVRDAAMNQSTTGTEKALAVTNENPGNAFGLQDATTSTEDATEEGSEETEVMEPSEETEATESTE